MAAWYNEIDPYAAQWLRNLITAGHIAPGVVDERSITDVDPDELAGYAQCHFFAGIGVWSHALRLAGWPDDRPVWTGSCPCQPFSVAGRGAGLGDARHLWPVWRSIIERRNPPVIFGEQVEAAIRHGWLDLVCNDLEGLGYAVGAIGLPAAGAGAPHIRQRLWIVADAAGERRERLGQARQRSPETDGRGAPGRLGDADRLGRDGRQAPAPRHDDDRASPVRAQDEHGPGLADAHRVRRHGAGPTDGFWRDADWLFCRDDRWRPVEPGTCPLADGAAARVGRLRAYGNAIVPQVAAEVIRAYVAYQTEQMT